jgi:hypothetical protein
MAKIKATVVADETMQRLAKRALEVQDACNLCGVAQAFARDQLELSRSSQSTGTAWRNQHPITLLWLDKLCHLSGYPQASFSRQGTDVFTGAADLADGKDITFEYEEI